MLVLMMQTVELAAHGPAEHIGAGMLFLWIVYYLVRHFFGKRKYEKKLRTLEHRMEDEASGESTLSGSGNPGRTTVELVEIVYDEVKDIQKTLTRHEGELGKIKGKLDIQ